MCNQTVSEDRKIVDFKRKSTDDLQKKETAKRSKMSSPHSNNMAEAVKTFCCECDKAVLLSGLKEHLITHGKMTVKEYKKLYGNPMMQIIQPVFHSCQLCTKDVLLDYQIIKKHLNITHQEEFTTYSNRFLATARKGNSVIIKCDDCGKTFKKNIQLKVHSKRHEQPMIDTSVFRGFKSNEAEKKVFSLDRIVLKMETTLLREKQAFQQLLRLTY